PWAVSMASMSRRVHAVGWPGLMSGRGGGGPCWAMAGAAPIRASSRPGSRAVRRTITSASPDEAIRAEATGAGEQEGEGDGAVEQGHLLGGLTGSARAEGVAAMDDERRDHHGGEDQERR